MPADNFLEQRLPAVLTAGGWIADEPASCAEFDRRVALCGLFKSHSEVRGFYTQPRAHTEDSQPRIDRILIPTKSLIGRGWINGAIGVECKASGKKVGPIIAQCLDYSRAHFKLPDSHITVACEWIFIWPMEKPGGDIGSIMDQNRIGAAFGHSRNLLSLNTSSCNALYVNLDRTFSVGKLRQGCKVGSR